MRWADGTGADLPSAGSGALPSLPARAQAQAWRSGLPKRPPGPWSASQPEPGPGSGVWFSRDREGPVHGLCGGGGQGSPPSCRDSSASVWDGGGAQSHAPYANATALPCC